MDSAPNLLGRILRAPLSLIPPDAQVRVLRGPLRGKKWIAGAASHSCWTGAYEAALLTAFRDAIAPGHTVYDVGSNVGIFALLAGIRTAPSGHVYAFEPVPRNLRYLRRHLELNAVKNCTVVEAAVSDTLEPLRLAAADREHSMARLSPEGELTVASLTLDACIFGERAFRPPDVVKIDVEGAEREVLRGAARAIAEFRPALFVEVHGTEHHADCKSFLLSHGYHVQESYGHLEAVHPAKLPSAR
jgi:FkbM family methyltransferase